MSIKISSMKVLQRNIIQLYTEETNNINDALQREKQLKKWNREWKIRLIDEYNPEWIDLYDELI